MTEAWYFGDRLDPSVQVKKRVTERERRSVLPRGLWELINRPTCIRRGILEFFGDHGLLSLLLSAYSEDLHWYETPDIMSCRCVLCDRTFDNDEALQQHKRGASAHAIDCATYDRHFGSEEALDQHLRDSPAHAASLDCESCNRSFGSEEALN